MFPLGCSPSPRTPVVLWVLFFPLGISRINRREQSISLAYQMPGKKWDVEEVVICYDHDLRAIWRPLSHIPHSWGMKSTMQEPPSCRWQGDSQEKWLFWSWLWILSRPELDFSVRIHPIITCSRNIGCSCMILNFERHYFLLVMCRGKGQVSKGSCLAEAVLLYV